MYLLDITGTVKLTSKDTDWCNHRQLKIYFIFRFNIPLFLPGVKFLTNRQ